MGWARGPAQPSHREWVTPRLTNTAGDGQKHQKITQKHFFPLPHRGVDVATGTRLQMSPGERNLVQQRRGAGAEGCWGCCQPPAKHRYIGAYIYLFKKLHIYIYKYLYMYVFLSSRGDDPSSRPLLPKSNHRAGEQHPAQAKKLGPGLAALLPPAPRPREPSKPSPGSG